MTLRRTVASTLLAVALGAASPLGAQVRLSEPVAFPEDFGTIQTVRVLPDGTVLVADPLAKALYAVDLDAGSRRVVGAEGEGPQEYLQPDAVWPLPGDSTLLVDLGNGRVVALGPDLGFGPTMPIALTEPGPGRPLVLALPQGVDAQGRLYSRSMGMMGGGTLPDSAAILRIDRATRAADTVARFKLPDRTQATSGGADNRRVQISNVPLSPEDGWGVAPDGSVVVVRSGEYRVEWHRPDGSVTRGPAIPYDPVPIGRAEKEEWVAEQGRSGGGIGIGVSIVNGSATMSFQRGGAGGGRDEIDGYSWPEAKPPAYAGRIPVDPEGRAWVRRHTRAGRPTAYDVFDREGRRVQTVSLEPGKRIVGFGPGSVYVVAFDEFDLNYLERYAMPGF
ncbi:MAG TPA: hypothetical protein VK849_05045 [Longimicrobiales bacterium]|nr:hypothetical protein [Longimicrobiales bacterium]